MHYIDITQPGDAGVLQAAVTDTPEPEPGQVLIRVHAAGVNRLDIMQRQGKYPPPQGASDIPGVEVAGTVTACAMDGRGAALQAHFILDKTGDCIKKLIGLLSVTTKRTSASRTHLYYALPH
ncbi:MAG: alcohol dehydrogenase catalytic domain-containing protein [Gammaproteobacteria bacterium]